MARGHICRTGLSIWRTPEACQEISRGLSERQRAQPPVIRSKKRRTPAGCEESLHPYRVRLSLDSLARWYALKNARVPPANFRARLRRGAKSINLRGISAANGANSANTRAIRVLRAIRGSDFGCGKPRYVFVFPFVLS